MPELFCHRGTTPLSRLVDHLTELYALVDDFLATHPDLRHWRQSPHARPRFADSAVLTLGLLPGCLGVASLKQTHRLVAAHYRSAFVLVLLPARDGGYTRLSSDRVCRASAYASDPAGRRGIAAVYELNPNSSERCVQSVWDLSD